MNNRTNIHCWEDPAFLGSRSLCGTNSSTINPFVFTAPDGFGVGNQTDDRVSPFLLAVPTVPRVSGRLYPSQHRSSLFDLHQNTRQNTEEEVSFQCQCYSFPGEMFGAAAQIGFSHEINPSHLLIANTPEFHTHSVPSRGNKLKIEENTSTEAHQEEVRGTCILAAIFCFII